MERGVVVDIGTSGEAMTNEDANVYRSRGTFTVALPGAICLG
jgi:hypothetical protein